MKKIILIGRSGSGKTTLTQALQGKKISYHKTHYINHHDIIIDTPGEYAETKSLATALGIYSFEADVIGFLLSATEEYTLYSPNIVPYVTREVIGIVTQIDRPNANPKRAEEWLKLAGCETIFKVSSYTGEGIWQIYEHLREPGDVLPWDKDIKGLKNIV
ncbi:MAG: ethanolamine utilization protein EutP [Clostridiales bacterium]|nr:ethanolamine utilization protein EutP [Clostridiales bacterium]